MRPKGVKVLSIVFAIPSVLVLLYGSSRLLIGVHSSFTVATKLGWGMSGNAEIAMVTIGLIGLIIAFGLWNLKKWAFIAVMAFSILNVLLGLDLLLDVVKFDALALLFGLLQMTVSVTVTGYLVKVRKAFSFG